ncbi:MAG: hypothetical protein K0S07_211 [Chlamydiales bacterium]|jgi:hypothetical protein|nr:hypothetical protein [Chlamydiales bacterium]
MISQEMRLNSKSGLYEMRAVQSEVIEKVGQARDEGFLLVQTEHISALVYTLSFQCNNTGITPALQKAEVRQKVGAIRGNEHRSLPEIASLAIQVFQPSALKETPAAPKADFTKVSPKVSKREKDPDGSEDEMPPDHIYSLSNALCN